MLLKQPATGGEFCGAEFFFIFSRENSEKKKHFLQEDQKRKDDKNMYKKVSTDMNFVEREKKVEKFWADNDIFQKSMKEREGNPMYTFYDGPPTANGKPHIGHVLTRVIKDMIPRYRTMKGYQVPRKAGWDTHGLPVELEVEKLLGLDGKDQIEEYGLEPFIDKCKESVWKYKGMWMDRRQQMENRISDMC